MPAPSVRRGFTDHEMLPEFAGGLIHMNGRIYDPNLGRFMTADPHVQFAGYSQSYNRYSYILNNPLGGTDPSGFFNLLDPAGILPDSGGWLNPGSSQWDDLQGAIQNWAKNPIDNFNVYALERAMPGRATMDNFMLSHEWAMDLGHVALAFASAFCYAGAAACYAAMEAHVAGYTTWLAGGSHEDAFGNMIEAGAIAFVSASANYAIGQGFNINGANVSPGTRIGNVLAHAALGCAMAEAGGGKCGAGALSGAITAGADQINTGSFSGGFAMAMVAGCAGSAAGGGSCSRGAASSALIYLYNANGIYNSRDDNCVCMSQEKVYLATQSPSRIEWSGVINSEFSIPLTDMITLATNIKVPRSLSVSITVGTEKGYNVYEYQIGIQHYENTIKGGQILSKSYRQLEMTGTFVWMPNSADATVHVRSRMSFSAP